MISMFSKNIFKLILSYKKCTFYVILKCNNKTKYNFIFVMKFVYKSPVSCQNTFLCDYNTKTQIISYRV